MHSREDLVSLSEQEITKNAAAAAAERPLPQPVCKWAACSSDDNGKMWIHIVQTALYQIFMTQSAGHSDVHVAVISDEEQGSQAVRLFAAKDHKPRTLLLLPWNMPLTTGDVSRPTGAVPAQLTVAPYKEKPVTVNFWIKPKRQPSSSSDLTQSDKALTLVPFWTAVAQASSQADGQDSNLDYATAVVQLPTPPPVAKGVRVHKGSMTLKVVCLTSTNAISKGARLTVAGKPSRELPEENLIAPEETT